MKISLVSLGCLKNQADSEGLLNLLGSKGYSYTEYPDSADVLLVNTCGFIEDAKRESIDTILTLAHQKKKDPPDSPWLPLKTL
jgi:ribosomal protein S12 methylthiotransferase